MNERLPVSLLAFPRIGSIFLSTRLLLIGLLSTGLPSAASVFAADPPNILWITAEDMSPTLGCYGDEFATTPHIDALAKQSTRYTHAFATAPVCSPSRACLINGCVATSQGTHAMRSEFPLPDDMTGFPALLRQRGYYTTNNEKTDYNSGAAPRIIDASWDDCGDQAHWRGRKKDQPFFAIFNLMTSHQSRTMVWPYEQFQAEVQSKLSADQIHDPAEVPLPPYYPDTPVVRKTVARFYDCVTAMDAEVGELLRQLHEDGLDDNTIVFFYSDHGSGMPRHKRTLFDSGMHVPLMIRFPSGDAQRPTAPGETIDQLVCFEDFGPTVLSLAGVTQLPDHMRGQPFLGPLKDKSKPHMYLFGHRDRVDEAIDMTRSVRSRDFLYIRNFMPHLSWNQTTSWPDEGEIRHEFYALAKSGNPTPAQAQFVGPTRPREALFDCREDPLNLNNLAGSPDHASTLANMREALAGHLERSGDLGCIPEIELWRLSNDSPPMTAGIAEKAIMRQRRAAAETVGTDDFSQIQSHLNHQDASIRYWGAVACSAAESIDHKISDKLTELMSDESPAVQIEAAGALARHGQSSKANATLVSLLSSDDLTVLLHAARTIEVLGDPAHRQAMQQLLNRFTDDPRDLTLFIRFAATGYLSRLEQG
tara:strand:- start:50335 stop:52275 length:1941 start_codon:yes stop_codon:yes gene_type:complete